MKVEYYDNSEYGFFIKVAYDDYVIGIESEEEFDSLCYAIEVFTSATNSDFIFDRKVYDNILQQLSPDNTIIIRYVHDDYCVSGRSLLIQIKSDNELIPVVYKDKGHWYPFDRNIPRNINRKAYLS